MIKIEKVGSLYCAVATPPHVRADWATEAPMPVHELVSELCSRGAHQKDVGDAFYAADPDWISN